MSELRVDNIVSADGSEAPVYSKGVKVSAGQTLTNQGDFTTSGTATISGPVTFAAGAEITGVTTFKSDLNNVRIAGVTTFADGAIVSGLTTFSSGVSGINVVGPTTFTQGATVTGVVTFSSGVDITSATLRQSGGLTVGGATTITGTLGVGEGITAGSGTFTNNVSVGGTLTYSDVENVDSVGLITARTGIHIGDINPGDPVSVAATISTYGDASFVGVATATSFSGPLTGNVTGNVTGSQSGGSVAATSYEGNFILDSFLFN